MSGDPWRLAEPVDGGLQVEMDHISLRRSLAQGAAEGPYLVEGRVSGTVSWRMRCGPVTDVHVPGDGRPVRVAAAAQRLSKVAVDSWLPRTTERWGSPGRTAATRRSPDRGYL